MEQSSGPVPPDRPFVEFPGADDSAAGFFLCGRRTGIEHDRQKTDFLAGLSAHLGKFRLQSQSAFAVCGLLQWTLSITSRSGTEHHPGSSRSNRKNSLPGQARASLFLPLARRLFRTRRPPRVDILARNPHLCALLILDG